MAIIAPVKLNLGQYFLARCIPTLAPARPGMSSWPLCPTLGRTNDQMFVGRSTQARPASKTELYRYKLEFAVLYQSPFRWRNFIPNKFPEVVFVTCSAMDLHHA